MTEEQKELLTNDLCGRLPYRVKIKTGYSQIATLISLRKNINLYSGKDLSVTYDISGKDEPFQMEERWGTPISEIKPYLFPMSSMTEEQENEWDNLHFNPLDAILEGKFKGEEERLQLISKSMSDPIQWCYKNHFDCNGLIPLGLAIDCTNLKIY